VCRSGRRLGFNRWNTGVSQLAVAPLALLLHARGRCSSAECKASVCTLLVPHWYVGILVPLCVDGVGIVVQLPPRTALLSSRGSLLQWPCRLLHTARDQHREREASSVPCCSRFPPPRYVGGLLAFLLAVPWPYVRSFRAHQEQMKRQDEAESAAADAAAALGDLRARVAGAYGATASPDGYPRPPGGGGGGGFGVAHGVAIDPHEARDDDGDNGDGEGGGDDADDEGGGEGDLGGRGGGDGGGDGDGDGEVYAAQYAALRRALPLPPTAVAVGMPLGAGDLAVIEGVVAVPEEGDGDGGGGAVRHPEGVAVVVGQNVTFTREGGGGGGIATADV